MKQIIRECVFETNSSSVHTISIAKSGRRKSELPMDDDGYILADYGQFGTEDHDYTSQVDKLSYLITQAYYINHYNTPNRDDCWTFEHIEDAICEYTGAKGIRILDEQEPAIDHQSQPEYGELKLVDEYDKDSIIDFVFNSYITLHTDCD